MYRILYQCSKCDNLLTQYGCEYGMDTVNGPCNVTAGGLVNLYIPAVKAVPRTPSSNVSNTKKIKALDAC